MNVCANSAGPKASDVSGANPTRSRNAECISGERHRQRYHCKDCRSDFDDLTNTVFAHHHQPLRKWILCLYLMGLNLSNEQIAEELDLNKDDVQEMTTQLRSGVVDLKPESTLQGIVECDEVYIVAGHKGHPEAVKKKALPDDADA